MQQHEVRNLVIILTDDEDDNDITMPYQQESNSIEIAKNQIIHLPIIYQYMYVNISSSIFF